MMIHPMHLHGLHMTVIAKDGWGQRSRSMGCLAWSVFVQKPGTA
jgi:FtsP/CotA-like multicopper oxidase with cupredoxin domain